MRAVAENADRYGDGEGQSPPPSGAHALCLPGGRVTRQRDAREPLARDVVASFTSSPAPGGRSVAGRREIGDRPPRERPAMASGRAIDGTNYYIDEHPWKRSHGRLLER